MFEKEASYALTYWERVSDRLIVAHFKTRFQNITIQNAYAPTNVKEIQLKKQFYKDLQEL